MCGLRMVLLPQHCHARASALAYLGDVHLSIGGRIAGLAVAGWALPARPERDFSGRNGAPLWHLH